MNEEKYGLGLSIKQTGMALGSVFAITLVAVLVREMSTEAMAVILGIVCGVAAGIPTSVLLLVVLTRREQKKIEGAEWQAKRNYPPVVVIQGGAGQALPQGLQASYWPAPAPGPMLNRQFHVVGEDDLVANS
ncbi:hypothetical protein ACFLTC_03470 [Chloroflexota bacterium]